MGKIQAAAFSFLMGGIVAFSAWASNPVSHGGIMPSCPTQSAVIIYPEMPGYDWDYTGMEREVEILAKTVYGEAGVCSADEQRLVIWTVLQRVDDDRFPDTIEDVITTRGQFNGYRKNNPVTEDIRALCERELSDWIRGAEPPTFEPYAPETPYLYFDGRRDSDGKLHNWFRKDW